jgi:hypothetical protein
MIRYARSGGGSFFAHIQKPVKRSLAVVAVPHKSVPRNFHREAHAR